MACCATDAANVWRLAWHGFDLEKEKAQDMSICDFCSARPVAWIIPCTSFQVPTPPGVPRSFSQGDWAACDACGKDIEARNQPALFDRAAKVGPPGVSLSSLPRDVRRLLKEFKYELHERFWRHYQGGAVRVTPKPFGH